MKNQSFMLNSSIVLVFRFKKTFAVIAMYVFDLNLSVHRTNVQPNPPCSIDSLNMTLIAALARCASSVIIFLIVFLQGKFFKKSSVVIEGYFWPKPTPAITNSRKPVHSIALKGLKSRQINFAAAFLFSQNFWN